jgi:hypothetical protein
LRHSRIPALSDNAGFYQPSWYSTIRAAVLDPRLKQADVIAREHDGIHVFRYNVVNHDWKELGSAASVRPFADTDAGGTDWTQAKYYSTIQLADLTGDGAAELVGRGRNGMQAWQWNPANESWTQLAAAGEIGGASSTADNNRPGTFRVCDDADTPHGIVHSPDAAPYAQARRRPGSASYNPCILPYRQT